MRIGTRQIGPDTPPYVIAELGVNHDGSVERALELVRAAAVARANAIKLQLFSADLLMSRAAKLAAYQRDAGEQDPIQMLRRLELSVEQMEPIVALSHELGLHAIVTVFSLELVAAAERLPWDAYKTASPDIINKPLLDALAATGKPLIVSTGASTLDEVRRAIDWLAPIHDRLSVLQCVSSYPTPIGEHNIGGMYAIAGAFRGAVGYSDHTSDVRTGFLAVANGAVILEKHLTYDRNAAGPDHAASLDPEQFREYVAHARSIWDTQREGEMLRQRLRESADPAAGQILAAAERQAARIREEMDPRRSGFSGEKRVLLIEEDVRRVSRQSLTTTRALPAGHRVTRADLTIKRPGTGIPPYELDSTIGRTLARAVEGDMPVMVEDLA